jgi:Zn-dependent M28 family amino/carboxypeptidase
MHRSAFVLLACGLAAACTAPPPATPAASAAADAAGPREEEIRASDLQAHVDMLASDLFEGRAPGTRGGELAARYLAAQLQALGVAPGAPGGSYFQPVPIVESETASDFAIAIPGRTFRHRDDVVAFSDVEDPTVRVSAEVVFVGYGIAAPELQWNDYAGVDVKGKWVLIMVNDPPAPSGEPQLFGGPALTYYGRWTYKYEEAARQGAAGAILIHTPQSATYPWTVVQSSWTGTQYALPPRAGQPALGIKAWITDAGAVALARRGGHDLDALRARASARGFTAVPLGVTASATLRQKTRRKTSPNVIGLIAGRDATQAVVYTGHYDHYGVRAGAPGEDTIFNGAYDNASGCAGLLEIAQAFARAGTPPARSIYVVFTTGEEAGLLGSEFFAANPPLPMAQVAANINVDGVNYLGPTRDLVLLGAERSSLGPLASSLAKARNRVVAGDSEPGRGYFFRSDHFPLAKAGVPAVSISEPVDFVTGKDAALKRRAEYNERHYHQPSDEIDPSWDWSGGIEDLKLLAALGWRIAAEPTPPAYNPGDQFGEVRKR